MFGTVEVKEVKVAVGSLIKTARKQRKLTQQEVAERIQVSRNTIQNLEAGKNFTADTLLRVLKDFDLLEPLFHRVKDQQKNIEQTKPLY